MLLQYLKHSKYEESNENQVTIINIKQELMSDGRNLNIALASINGQRNQMCFILFHWFEQLSFIPEKV